MVLSDGRITVTPNDAANPLHDVAYESVQSIDYSRGRDPLWSAPDGPTAVARASGGALGIFRGERDGDSLRQHRAIRHRIALEHVTDGPARLRQRRRRLGWLHGGPDPQPEESSQQPAHAFKRATRRMMLGGGSVADSASHGPA